jgi:hypothetical protein
MSVVAPAPSSSHLITPTSLSHAKPFPPALPLSRSGAGGPGTAAAAAQRIHQGRRGRPQHHRLGLRLCRRCEQQCHQQQQHRW